MSKRKAAASARTTTSDISKLEEKFFCRYVRTPLKFWIDGEWEVPDPTSDVVIGQMIKIKMVKNREKDVVAVVWYAPTVNEKDTVCETKFEIVRNMLLPPDYKPDAQSFFYEESKSGSGDDDSQSDNDTSSKRQRTSQVSDDDDKNPTDPVEEEDNAPNNKDDEHSRGGGSASCTDSDGDSGDSSDNDDDMIGLDSETETEDEEDVITPTVKVNWNKSEKREHTPLKYEGPINQDAIHDVQKNGMANHDFFYDKPNPMQCFFTFVPIS